MTYFRLGAAVLIGSAAVFSLSQLSASGAPPSNAASGARVFHYVSLGDSVTGVTPSFVDILATQASASLHGKVVVTRTLEEGSVADLLHQISSAAKLRQAIRSADIITIAIGVNEIVKPAYEGKPKSVPSAESTFEKSYGALLTQLAQLRPPSKAAYRLLTSYNIPGVFHGATARIFLASLRAENRFVCAQAPQRRMKCADVFTAFNGADGSRDPRAAGLIVADGHPSAKGSAAIAKVVLGTGFAPLR